MRIKGLPVYLDPMIPTFSGVPDYDVLHKPIAQAGYVVFKVSGLGAGTSRFRVWSFWGLRASCDLISIAQFLDKP